MNYAQLGRSGLLVSQFCLGTPNFGAPPSGDERFRFLVEADAARVLDRAIDHGVNILDTADYYGAGVSEQVLGRLLAGRRGRIVITSKVGLRTGPEVTRAGLSRRHILQSVDESLERLATDWIDLYLVHRTDPLTPLEETLDALDQVVRAGKVRYIGYCNWPDWQAAKAIGLQERHGWARFVAAQLYYSLAGRELDHETIPFLEDAGIGLMAWSPLANGYLTGKYTADDPTGGNGRRATFQMGPFDQARADRVVAVLREIAAAHSATPAQVALAWTSQRAATVLLGVSSLDQLESNLEASRIHLSANEEAALDAASATDAPYPTWYNNLMRDVISAEARAGGTSSLKDAGEGNYRDFYGGRENPASRSNHS